MVQALRFIVKGLGYLDPPGQIHKVHNFSRSFCFEDHSSDATRQRARTSALVQGRVFLKTVYWDHMVMLQVSY